MLDSIYSRIDHFIRDRITTQSLYIQEGSGGYYISSYEGSEIGNSKFINRIAQIVEEEGEFKLTLKNFQTGQWGEYNFFPSLEECLETLANSLDGAVTTETREVHTFTKPKPTEIRFSCWSCNTLLFSVTAEGESLSVDWADSLESVEFVCPVCKIAMLYDLSSEKDRSLIFHGSIDKQIVSHNGNKKKKTQPPVNVNVNELSQINIDFNDLVWRLKDHSNFSVHYLNLLTGRLERINTKEFGSKDVISEYERFPWYRVIPVPSKEAYGTMEKFVTDLEDGPSKVELEAAIAEQKPFKKFKQVIQDYPGINEEWIQCENEFYEAKAREWLSTVNINYKLLF